MIFPEFNDSENPTSDIRHPTSNIIIKGPLDGKDKVELILDTTYFILPSQSEGFPTSILEAMTHGCIPVFTEGCNFPEALEAGVGIEIKYDEYDIRRKLEEISVWTVDKQNEISRKTKKFADENYNWKSIVSQQIKLYTEITGF